jgi:hypothetical protein
LAPDTLDGPEIEAAMFAAEAQVEILRVRRAKVDLVNRAANHLRDEDARALPPCERATMGFAQKSKTLVAFDRYERRALSRRNQALRRLRTLQRLEAISRKKSADAVGPPRSKNKSSVSNRFVRNVLKLELRSLQKAAIHAGLKPPLEARWVTIEIPCWSWRLGEKILAEISVRIELRGGTGSLRLVFNANGEPVTQTFAIVHIPTRIGGGHWVIQCPKTHNPVVPGLRRATLPIAACPKA